MDRKGRFWSCTLQGSAEIEQHLYTQLTLLPLSEGSFRTIKHKHLTLHFLGEIHHIYAEEKILKVFAWSPIRNLMKEAGAEMVAHEAVDSLIEHLEDFARDLTSKSLEMTRHANRKKLEADDIQMALDLHS